MQEVGLSGAPLKPHAVCIAFKEGVIWNFTNDPELAQEWCDRGVAECWAQYEAVSDLKFADGSTQVAE